MEKVTTYLHDRGLRSTHARRKIVEAVLESTDHFTADDLLARVRTRGERVSRASVYRTLALLADGGFVQAHEFQRGQLLYELALGQHHHDHLICTLCDEIVEFENDQIERLQKEVAARLGFALVDHALRLHGECLDPKCPRRPG